MKKSNKIKATVISLTLVACLAVAGVSAYFTDAGDLTNTFTIGEVKLELTEPNYPGNNSDDVKNITPGAEIEKDPIISNIGKNGEYVFLTVTVPYAEDLVVANPDGTKRDADQTQLFSYTVNDGWKQVGQVIKNTADKTNTYIYAYGTESELTALEAGKNTPALFNSVTFVNAVEGQNLENSTQSIEISAYAIQADNMDSDLPITVWNIICNQCDVDAEIK